MTWYVKICDCRTSSYILGKKLGYFCMMTLHWNVFEYLSEIKFVLQTWKWYHNQTCSRDKYVLMLKNFSTPNSEILQIIESPTSINHRRVKILIQNEKICMKEALYDSSILISTNCLNVSNELDIVAAYRTSCMQSVAC